MLSEKQITQATHSAKLLPLLGVCAIVASTPTTALAQLSWRQELTPVSQQRPLDQENANYPSPRNESAVLQALDLEKEWGGILGDASGLEFLAFAGASL